MTNEQRVLIYFDDIVNALTREYGKVMNTHIYSPREILDSIGSVPRVDAVEVVLIKEVSQKILETLDNIIAVDEPLANDTAPSSSYYRGKVNAYEVARRLVNAALNDLCSYGERKMVNLEDIVDLDAQTKANNEAMRKVIDFMAGERREGE